MATFYNQATLSFNGNTLTSNITTGEILEVLSASKNAVTATYSPDSVTAYIINIINNGQADAGGITVTDNLGEYETVERELPLTPLTYIAGSVSLYVNGVKQTAPEVTSEAPLTFSGISIPAGGNAALIYLARVNQYAPYGDGASIINTAEISGAGLTALTVSAAITPVTEPVLAISKTLSPTSVEESGTVTYTFLIQNSGSTAADASMDIIFSDTFDPVLSGLEATFNGTAWTEGSEYTYDEATGEFVSTAGAVTVPAATYSQDAATGAWTVQPGTATLVITGTI